jgi:hypothetical protein
VLSVLILILSLMFWSYSFINYSYLQFGEVDCDVAGGFLNFFFFYYLLVLEFKSITKRRSWFLGKTLTK